MPTYLYLKDLSGASAPSRTSSSITVGHGLSGASWNDAAYYDIQDRNEHQVQRGRRNHAPKNRRSDGYSARAARALRQHQWHDAQNERERSHQNGPQTDARRLHRGFDHRHAFTAQLLRKFNDQNRILAGEPDQHHQTDLAVNVVLQSAQGLRGLQNDVYCQIGLVMLIGLASKNAILIVEFAEQLRGKGMSVVEAAVEAARIRLRPILMTSLAFILGVVPLVLAQGAGRAGRISVGTTVFGGMIAATTLNLVFIPVLYVIVRSIVPGRETQSVAHAD